MTAIRVNLESSKYFLSKADQDKADLINLGLAQVLAGAALETPKVSARKISDLMEPHTDLTATLMSSPNTAAMGAMILEVVGYLSRAGE